MANLNQGKSGRVSHLPEHGPIDEKNGKEILLSVKNVDITFGKGDNAVRAVKNASFDIYKGETFSLVGESGSGKTTVGRAVIRVNPCASGEILYKGVRISGKIPHSLDREVIRNIQMVFQDPYGSLNPAKKIGWILEEPLKIQKKFTKEERKRLVKQIKCFTVCIYGTTGFQEAVVTCGGVCVDEIDPATMESKIVKGLYFAGEVLDVDAYTGGFNLQIAFSTGYTAGES